MRTSNTWRRAFTLSMAACVAGGAVVAGAQRSEAPPASGAPVTVTKVIARSLDRPLSLPGELIAFQDVEIRAKVSGFVETVDVDRGSAVRRGQLLVRIVAPELAAQKAEADARVQSARAARIEAAAKLASDEATFQRLKTASATPGVVAGNDVDIAERTVEADRARVDQLQQNETAALNAARSIGDLESYLRITAPFDGVITERDVHVGALVGPSGSPILRIQQISKLRLVVDVPETAVGSLQRGGLVEFNVPAYPGEKFSGRVARLGHALDPKTRTMPVELDVANAMGRLAPGMFAQVSWSMRRDRVSLFVPLSAIATTTERTFVVRVRDNRAEWVDVKRGQAMDQLVEVFGPLKEGDVVALRGTDELRQGSRVTPRLAAPPATQ